MPLGVRYAALQPSTPFLGFDMFVGILYLSLFRCACWFTMDIMEQRRGLLFVNMKWMERPV